MLLYDRGLHLGFGVAVLITFENWYYVDWGLLRTMLHRVWQFQLERFFDRLTGVTAAAAPQMGIHRTLVRWNFNRFVLGSDCSPLHFQVSDSLILSVDADNYQIHAVDPVQIWSVSCFSSIGLHLHFSRFLPSNCRLTNINTFFLVVFSPAPLFWWQWCL